jgi:hypothetical protein
MGLLTRIMLVADRWAASHALTEPLQPGERVLGQAIEIGSAGNQWIATTYALFVQPVPSKMNSQRRDSLGVHTIPYSAIRELREEQVERNVMRRTISIEIPGEVDRLAISGVFKTPEFGDFSKVLSGLVRAASEPGGA